MNERQNLWAIGDIHGALPRLTELLREAGIIDAHDTWACGAVTGIAVGDYVNRGEQGAAVIALLRRLQHEAQAAGGQLITLLGNHDVLMYGVLTERKTTPYGNFASQWLLNGGRFLDLEALEHDDGAHAWLSGLPAMALIDDTLFVHCDSLAYLDLGDSIAAVNAEVRAILQSGDLDRIATLFDKLCRRRELRDPAAVERLLATFGGTRVVHGHTPTFALAPVITAGGRCIAIDGALWETEEATPLGFVFRDRDA